MAPKEVSVIIPIKDETDPYIIQCIESLKRQDYCGMFEILVAKGGNRAQARNLGIANAQGDIIAFIDSDCIAPDNWLSEIVNSLENNNDFGGVGGSNFSPENVSVLGKAIDIVFSNFLGSLGSASLSAPSKPRKVSALACINSAFKGKVLRQINGFDEEFELCEDTNLSYKVREAGYNLLFVKNIPVQHYRRDTVYRFSKQFFLYGMGRMRSMFTSRKYYSKGAIALISVAIFFPFFAWFFPLYATLLFGLYLCVISIIGFKGAINTGVKRFFLIVPSLFLVEHFSYLFGLFYGVIKGKWLKTENDCSIVHKLLLDKKC